VPIIVTPEGDPRVLPYGQVLELKLLIMVIPRITESENLKMA
jgi:hypothetical protein